MSRESFEKWWGDFKDAHEEWPFADREAILFAAYQAGEAAAMLEVKPVAWRYKTVRGVWRYVGNRPRPYPYMPPAICFPEPLYTLPDATRKS